MPIHPDERCKYIEAYGKPAWTDAVGKANGHRSRAKNDYGLTEHFTATEWLDLCADWDFRCAFCRTAREGFLTPHHLLPLARRGRNDIDNILPICCECHPFIHYFRINCHPQWLPTQLALCERFDVGDLVQYSPKREPRQEAKLTRLAALEDYARRVAKFEEDEKEPVGVVTEVIPPARRVSLFELIDNNGGCWETHANGCAVIGSKVTYWARSRAKVNWAWGPYNISHDQREPVDLKDVKKVNIQTYIASLNQAHIDKSRICAEQHQFMHEFMNQFSVGDWVDYGDPDRPYQGVILGITPPVLHSFKFPLTDTNDLHLVGWPSVTPPGAYLKWLTRKGLPGPHNVHVLLVDMKKAQNIPFLDERWVKQWNAWKGLTKPRSLYRAVKAVKEASRRKS